MDIYIGSASELIKMQSRDIQKVTKDNRNFTMAPNKKYFVQVNATEGSSQFDVRGMIIFRYFKWDPQCPAYHKWSGSACEIQWEDYCASKTEEYRKLYKEPEITVFYRAPS